MTFSSPVFFLLFLPLCLAGYWLIARLGRQWMVGYLLLMSLIFYAAWSKEYLLVLLASIAVNFFVSSRIAGNAAQPRRQTAWLVGGIVADLATLCFYKYLFPFLAFAHSIGMTHQSWGTTILPLGISFFTFTQIAYLVDLKQGAAGRESVGSYALFVTFFPHLVAGPILHHKEMMPQFRQERSYRFHSDDLALGITWFTMGFCKKTLIADRISPLANALFAAPAAKGTAETWLGALIYAMQLYFDFSGYSDMAIGLARMFSIRFPMNFNSPFKAENIGDFWQRWHMTLTHYIMAYVYAPIQMKVSRWRLDRGKKTSRKAQATFEGLLQMVLFPTIVTLTLAGVWHGAGLQFTMYGIMHGLFLSANHMWRVFVPEANYIRRRLLTRPVSIGVTFLTVVSTFVMFRANTVKDAIHIYGGLLGRHHYGTPVPPLEWLLLAGLFAVVWLLPNTQEVLGESQKEDEVNWALVRNIRWVPSLPWWVVTVAVFTICMAYSSVESTFLYFQF